MGSVSKLAWSLWDLWPLNGLHLPFPTLYDSSRTECFEDTSHCLGRLTSVGHRWSQQCCPVADVTSSPPVTTGFLLRPINQPHSRGKGHS